jgi:hypothetical protein
LILKKTINNSVGTGDATLSEKPYLFRLPTINKTCMEVKWENKNILRKKKEK